MHFKRLIIACALACASAASAQMVTVSAGNSSDASGSNVPINYGSAVFTPMTCPGPSFGFRKGGGGQSTNQSITVPIIAGAFTVSLPDSYLTAPQNIGFQVDFLDPQGTKVLSYSCVQPSLTAPYSQKWCGSAAGATGYCNFDKYDPQLPNVPVVNSGQSIVNNYNSEMLVDVDNYPGADLGARINYADNVFAGQPALFGSTLWGTISETVNLGPGHSLLITGTISFTGPGMIVPSQRNDIACIGASLVNAGMTNTALPNEYKPFFGTTTGGLNDVHIHGCDMDGGSNDYAQIFYTNGNGNVDLRIDHNRIHNGTTYVQNSASFTQPTVHLNLSDNVQTMDPGHAGGQYAITSYGPLQHSVIHHNVMSGMQGGVIIFGSDAGGNIGASNPSYDDVYTSGIVDDVIDHNITSGIVGTNSAVFLSMTAHMQVLDNSDDGAVDVSYDGESTVDSLFANNSSTNYATACFGGFYTQYHNVYRGNHCTTKTGAVGAAFQNAGGYPYIVDDILVEDNDYSSPKVIGIWTYQHASGHVTWRNNKVLNGTWANVSYQNDEIIEGNFFHFTFALPCTGIGDGQGPGTGIAMGNNDDTNVASAYEIARNNTIITDVPQPSCAAAIVGGLSYSNGPTPSRADIWGNRVIGPWATALSFSSGVTNAAYPPVLFLRDNNFDQGSIAITNSNGIAATVKSLNNFVGITLQPANN